MIQSDVLCSVWFERKVRKLQAGKTDTESGLKCNTLSQEPASSELLICRCNSKRILQSKGIGSYCTKVNHIFSTNSSLLKDTISNANTSESNFSVRIIERDRDGKIFVVCVWEALSGEVLSSRDFRERNIKSISFESKENKRLFHIC
jgi:hypothetical protein